MDYVLHIGVLILLYATLAVSLDLVVGQCGMLSICHAAFFGVGAYVCALGSVSTTVPSLVLWVGAMWMAAGVSVLVYLPARRLRGDVLALCTFCVQVVVFSIFNNWGDLTRGPLGVPGIPMPDFMRDAQKPQLVLLLLSILVACVTLFVVHRLVKSPLGRIFRGIREDDVFALSLGKNPIRSRAAAFGVSAALAALAGTLYAHHVAYVDPTSFTVTESIFMLSMVILGGAGSLWGPVVGAATLVLLPEVLRFAGLPPVTAANVRQMVYGLAIVLFMLWRPQGLIGEYAFGREAKQK